MESSDDDYKFAFLQHDVACTKADIIRAEDIFGANIGALQGKTVRKKSARVVTTIHELPMEIIEHHRCVTLEADIRNTGNTHDNNRGNTDSDAAEMNMQDNMSATEQEMHIGTNAARR